MQPCLLSKLPAWRPLSVEAAFDALDASGMELLRFLAERLDRGLNKCESKPNDRWGVMTPINSSGGVTLAIPGPNLG